MPRKKTSNIRSRSSGVAMPNSGKPPPRKTIVFTVSSRSLPPSASMPSLRSTMRLSPTRCASNS